MKTIEQVIKHSGIPAKLVRAVIRTLGGKDYLREVAAHGADAGFPGFSYYSDTEKFFNRNKKEIITLVNQWAYEHGETPIDMVANFRCLREMEVTTSSVFAVLCGVYDDRDDYIIIANGLAWFALECVANAFEE